MKKIFHVILIVFSFALISSAQTNQKKEAILRVEVENGKTLDEKNGVRQIIVPDEKKHGRWVRQVIALKIKKAQ